MKTVEVAMHSDNYSGGDAHPAINVKTHHFTRNFAWPDCPEEFEAHAWDILQREWWQEATSIAHVHNYSGVFAEGRSGGWLVPFTQIQGGKVRKFHAWEGQGGPVGTPTEGYPIYPDVSDPKERKQFLSFRKDIEDLLERVPKIYAAIVAMLIQDDMDKQSGGIDDDSALSKT